jgi:prepilin-type N-terminal cleavage/methylation domain-containing protein
MKGFTLNELLIVIAILAVMAGSAVIVLNPGELLGQGRDSKRIGELNSLASAITLHTNSVIGGYKGELKTVYISLPDTSENCDSILSLLPSLPVGWSYHCVLEGDLRKTDGDGWLPMNFNAMPGGSPFNQLPIDPENSAENNLYFAYAKSDTGYVLATLLESEKQRVKANEDGGSDPERFEIGSDFSLWAEIISP